MPTSAMPSPVTQDSSTTLTEIQRIRRKLHEVWKQTIPIGTNLVSLRADLRAIEQSLRQLEESAPSGHPVSSSLDGPFMLMAWNEKEGPDSFEILEISDNQETLIDYADEWFRLNPGDTFGLIPVADYEEWKALPKEALVTGSPGITPAESAETRLVHTADPH